MIEKSAPKRKLVLFDIDGTLVLYKGREAYGIFEDLARDLFGASLSLDHYRFSGKTDKAITYETLGLAGIADDQIANREPEIFEYVTNALKQRTSKESFDLLPNVEVLLDTIDATTTKALLTGNIDRCAEIKLSYFGLMRHFEFGVYGTESKDRNDLGPIALSKYREHAGEEIDPGNVVIIGDTVNDVLVAKHIGAKCIVTLTGRSTYDEVAPHKPEHIFDDLSDTARVLDAIYQ
jgi:phosphoglycolate phosphatase